MFPASCESAATFAKEQINCLFVRKSVTTRILQVAKKYLY